MASPGLETGSRQRRQVNVRISSKAVEVLEALVFLEGKGSLQELVAPLVEGYAEHRRGEPAVKAALQQRARYRPKEEITLWKPADE